MIRLARDTTPATPLSCDILHDHQDSPRLGAAIGPLTELKRRGSGATGLGRLGAAVYRRGARDLSQPLGLTCGHVLAASGGRVGDTVYQPRISVDTGEMKLFSGALNPVGATDTLGLVGLHYYAYPGEGVLPYHVDCAAVRLNRPAAGVSAVVAARAHRLDIAPPRRLKVRLFGLHDRSAGVLVDVAARVLRPDGRACENTLVIEALPGRRAFARSGDSGALVVDQMGRAIGLLWGFDLERPGRAFACHLLPALDCLGLVLARGSAMRSAR